MESIDSPFDEQGMDDFRISSEIIQFKNDLNLLILNNDRFETFEDQQKLEEKIYKIFVKKRRLCKKHKKTYLNNNFIGIINSEGNKIDKTYIEKINNNLSRIC